MVKNSPLGSSLMLVSPSPDLRAGCILFSVHSAGAGLSSLNQIALLYVELVWPFWVSKRSSAGAWPSLLGSAFSEHELSWLYPVPSQLAPSSFFSSKLAQKIHLLHPSKKWGQSPTPSYSSLYKNSNILEETPGTTQNDLHSSTLWT